MPFFKKSRFGLPHPIVKTSYTSKPVPFGPSFLTTPPPSTSTPITYTKLDFTKTPLPEYAGSYAVVLDHVLSPAECVSLINYAQLSAGAGTDGVENDGWQPAMVNAGLAGEFLAIEYRNSDRIIWDEKTVVQRLWERCLMVEEVRRDLAVLEGNTAILGKRAVDIGRRWNFSRLNERMRFLRYGKGQFFKEHCDGTYQTPDGRERTFYTLHLYLNDSQNTTSSTDDPTSQDSQNTSPPLVKGGATTFHSVDMTRRLDVDPKAGRVLIFQHAGLLHSGDLVQDGVKYTMRTDLLFEFDETSGSVG